MKLQEFRNLIREEIAKVLTEDTLADKVKSLGYDASKLQDYKVGKGERSGMPINPSKLKSILTDMSAKNIDSLIDSGVTFKKAFVTLRRQDNGKSVIMYSFIGTDANGNEIIFDKYEGYVPGFGQTYVFVNGEKKKSTNYLSSKAAGMPELSEAEKFFKKMSGTKFMRIFDFRKSKIQIGFYAGDDDYDPEDNDVKLKDATKIYNTLLRNKFELSKYFEKYKLPASKVVFLKDSLTGTNYIGYEVTIVSSKTVESKGRKLINSFDI
ncbi:MAG: hypothetical protein EBS19_08105 [Spirochaetia bacterium]|nr:hypothetical protein [Spirochaetia bacterium]